MVKGIVFDLDGTLVDSLAATFEGFNLGIGKFGRAPMSGEEIMSHFGPGEGSIFAKLVGEKNADEAYRIFYRHMEENTGKLPLFDGVVGLLDQLKTAGVPISIFTGRSWDTTEIILKYHGVLDRFVTVVAHDHVGSPKPSPEGLQLACKRMKLDPSEVLMVGDMPADMLAARLCGAHGVAALWDLMATREKLVAHSPKFWASHPDELWGIWESCRNSGNFHGA